VKTAARGDRSTGWLVGLWVLVAAIARGIGLAAKPAWRDEFATTVFALGNSFQTVPLDRAIAARDLLALLDPGSDPVRHLLAESTHPPLFFLVAHQWLQVFAPEGGWAALEAVRALSALAGVAAVPALYALVRSVAPARSAHVAALLMALSPFGVFLAREARHYTLATLWAIASLACFLAATRAIASGRRLPWRVVLAWSAANGLGVATHYLFVFVPAAQALVLGGAILAAGKLNRTLAARLATAAIATTGSAAMWLPQLSAMQGARATEWIYDGEPRATWLEPLARLLLWNLSQLTLLPSAVTATVPVAVAIASGLVTLGFALWLLPRLVWGWRQTGPVAAILGGYVAAAILGFLGCTYGLGLDLTLASRYQYVWFPAAIALLGLGLGPCWRAPVPSRGGQVAPNYRTAVMAIAFAALGAGVTVANLGYLQTPRADLLAANMTRSGRPLLIATTHLHHGQTGSLMAIAREFDRQPDPPETHYFLGHRRSGRGRDEPAKQALLAEIDARLDGRAAPFDLWLVDMRFQFGLGDRCDRQERGTIGEYDYEFSICGAADN